MNFLRFFILICIGFIAQTQYAMENEDNALAVTLDTVCQWESPSKMNYLPLAKKLVTVLPLMVHYKEIEEFGKNLTSSKTGISNIVHDVLDHCNTKYGKNILSEEEFIVNTTINVKPKTEIIKLLSTLKSESKTLLYLIGMKQDTKEATIWLNRLKEQGFDIDQLFDKKLTHRAYCDKVKDENENYAILSDRHYASKHIKSHPGFYRTFSDLIGTKDTVYFADVNPQNIKAATAEIKNLKGILVNDATTFKAELTTAKLLPIKYDEMD